MVAAEKAAAVELLKALVRIPSDNPPGDCAAAAEATAEVFEGLGLTVERHPVPQATVAAYGMISATNLVIRHRFGPGPTIALNAHGDVVPPGAGWTSDPYGGEVRDGWLYGRGAAVSKSDIVSFAFALKALIASGSPLKGAVELHITFDEEVGGYIGPGWLLSEGISRPDFAICTAFSYAVIVAHNGCLHLEVTVQGRSAHAAWADTGVDALEATVPLLGALYRYRDGLKAIRSTVAGISHPSLVVGLISGGINTNVVPDVVKFRLDRRILPHESPEAVEAELRALIADEAARLPGIAVEVRQVLLARPFAELPGADRLAEIVARHASALTGKTVATTASPLYTDARHYSEAGVPTIMYGAGPENPLDANGHRADERVPVETIAIATEVIAASITELLG
ncbi:MAG: M20/M25/M40 family metallo-hydrolase [Beijerinckiaceae bacterium]|nr:M20/M25/M40 family metallo-hydrolase [Beijerinckiaceae bacterium]